ncbi:hypothetical protein H4582DRAFT_1305195 [Lactarius indigo]|nr:hypothetical protein H4582DRAFT_1305195 [Lactarius indigo]
MFVLMQRRWYYAWSLQGTFSCEWGNEVRTVTKGYERSGCTGAKTDHRPQVYRLPKLSCILRLYTLHTIENSSSTSQICYYLLAQSSPKSSRKGPRAWPRGRQFVNSEEKRNTHTGLVFQAVLLCRSNVMIMSPLPHSTKGDLRQNTNQVSQTRSFLLQAFLGGSTVS